MTQLTVPASAVDTGILPVLNHLDFLCRIALPGSLTGGELAIIEERGRLGCMTPRHIHQRESETFLVVDGALQGWCEGEFETVEAGNLIHLPPGREHAFRVLSESARFYALIAPAGFESFFTDTGTVLTQSFEDELPTPGPVTPEEGARLSQVLAPLGCTITGPPPF